MTSSADTSSNGNVGLSTILFVVFLVLKLTHVIGWSWWWVTAPLWIPAGFAAVLIVIGLIVGLLATGARR